MPQPGDLDDLAGSAGRDAMRRLRQALRAIEKALKAGRGTEFDEFSLLRRKQAIEAELLRLEADLPQALEDAARKAAKALHRGPADLGVDAGAISAAASNAAMEVRAVTDGLRAELNSAITRAFTGELDAAGLEQAIRDAFDGEVLEHRVERIIRTEVGEVFGRQQARVDQELAGMGADLIKRWVTAQDGRTRPSHAAIHGQERELDEPFSVGDGATASTPPGGPGFPADAPLDPGLPAGDRINCRCTVVRVPRSQARQAYIAKRQPERLAARAQV